MNIEETDTIRDLELKKFATEKRLDDIRDQMHSIERECTLAVETEWETSKNKALSNAQKRADEVKQRLAQDDDYTNLHDESAKLLECVILMRIDIDYLKRKRQTQLFRILDRICGGAFHLEE